MSLTAKLALQQIRLTPKRTVWTVAGIALSVAMLTAVNGFAASGMGMLAGRGRALHINERIGFIIIAAVLGGVIAIASIIVISNAFRVSAIERTRQFGILKSVGATKKQIAATVMYEGVFLGIIGLPLGVVMGLITQYIAIFIANRLFVPLNNYFVRYPIYFPVVVSGYAIIVAVIGAFIVIMLSSWLPARKAAKETAVISILGQGDVKPKKAILRNIVRRCFGFEGYLAVNQLKRSRHNFRASVISLTISIVLLLAAASAQANLLRQVDVMYGAVNANAEVRLNIDIFPWYYEDGGWKITTLAGDEIAERKEMVQTMGERLAMIPYADIRSYGATNYRFVQHDDETLGFIRLLAVEPELYESLTVLAGVPYGSTILINIQRETDINGITRETHPHGDMVGMSLDLYQTNFERVGDWDDFVIAENKIYTTHRNLTIDGQITLLPDDMFITAYYVMSVIVPDMLAAEYTWFVLAENAFEFVMASREVLDGLRDEMPHINIGGGVINRTLISVESEVMANIATVFIYGFVGMLTLIGVTNVISTISTNTKIRVREFAILASVGMTRGGIGKMLALESLLCSVRALMFGLPLGLLAAYGVYVGTQMDRVRFSFILPWQAMIISIAAVFVLTFVTTMFSASRLRNENIIEAIR